MTALKMTNSCLVLAPHSSVPDDGSSFEYSSQEGSRQEQVALKNSEVDPYAPNEPNEPNEVVHTLPLSEEEHSLCRQLLNEDFDDHKLVSNFRVLGSSVQLMKKEKKGSNILQYVASGLLPIAAETLLALCVDNEYRSVWDETSVETRGISRVNHYTEAVYSITKYPSPLSKRDYVYHRRMMQFDNAVLVASSAANTPKVAESWRKVRISNYQSLTIVRPISETSCNLAMLYFEDPRAILPSFAINWVTATALPSMICKTIEAAASYPRERLSSVLKSVPRLDVSELMRCTSAPNDKGHYSLCRGYNSLWHHLYRIKI